jgi:undecaprenyl-diphosphatase
VWLTKIGTHGLVWFVLAAVVAVLLRNVWVFVVVAAAILLADGIAGLVKVIVGENRPNEPGPLVAIPHSHSFPSGHTATSFAAATALSAFYPRGAPGFFLLAAAIAYSRLYVGAHFPLDVAGGIVIGVATALLLLAAVRRRSGRLPQRG